MNDSQTDHIFTPLETANATVEHIKGMRDGRDKSIPFPIDGISSYFAPLRPGQIAAIIGQTSHYKSGLLHAIERTNAEGLNRQEARKGEVIFHISTEEDVEEQGMIEIAHYSPERMQDLAQGHVVDWDGIIKASFSIGDVPIYRIGMSLSRKGHFSDLHLSNVAREIEVAMNEFDIRPASIYVDYLQALPIDPEIRNAPHDQQRRLQVRSDVYRLKEMAVYFACPIWAAIQAKQNLDSPLSQTFLMPGQYDGEETSAIAQRFDRLVTIWMPKQSWPIGKEVSLNKETAVRVEEDMLFIRVAKQRGNLPSGKMWLCRVDFAHNTIKVDTSMKTYMKGTENDTEFN